MKFGQKELARRRRQARVRKKVTGIPDRPRLCVFRSTNHIYCQLIDDLHGHTLTAASSLSDAFRERVRGIENAAAGNVAGAKIVGALVAEYAFAIGITCVIFDRNGFLYHGRVKALAEGAREAGLQF
jgi:large subunit ribosomal protein L18